MVRQEGSGYANETAAAIEEMVAAALRGDDDDVQLQRQRLQHQEAVGRCGMPPSVIVDLVRGAVARLDLDATDAFAQPLDGLGDVRAELRGGGKVWIEVKAQTKKDRFTELTQTDWIHDETDLLRWIFHRDRLFASHLPDWVRQLLHLSDPEAHFAGWDQTSLWVADMALLRDRVVRERAGIGNVPQLEAFMKRKFVLHLTREGVRVVRLDKLRPVAAALSGKLPEIAINYANKSAASIAIACPGPPSWGAVHFTYHFGYPTGVVGRHKMHAISLDVGTDGIELCL